MNLVLRAPRWLLPVAWLAVFLGIAGALHTNARVPWDADTSYHFAVARLIREHGLLHTFPWTAFSWQAQHYADKELLFHLLFVPLTGLGWITAAHVLGTLLSAAMLWTLYLVLRSEGARFPGAWVLLALGSSGYFLMRLALVRPHLLSVTLALVVTWAAARRRYRPLAVAAFLFPFCYVAWHQALILALIAEAAYLIAGQRPGWRGPAVVLGGLAAGVLVHPQFPEIVRTSWIVSFEILFATAWAKKGGFDLGTEFGSFISDPMGLVIFAAVPLLLAGVGAAITFARRRAEPAPLAFALVALAWAAMTLGSARFIEYLAPFSVVALAGAFRSRAWPGPLLASGALVFTAALGLNPVRSMRLRADDFPPPVAQRFQSVVPEGAQVFTCGWLTTGEMMLALPNRRFIVALDPVLFFRWNPELYRRWYELVHRPPARPSAQVREEFGARFVLCESRLAAYREFLTALARDPGARVAAASDLWVLFEVLP